MRKPHLIILIGAFAAIGLYTIYWFAMADQIKQEIQSWVEDQAEDGTQVTFEDISVSGYPFSLIAEIQEPDIYVSEGDRQPHWHGERLRAKTRPYSYRHVDILFDGRQTITFLDDTEPALDEREPLSMAFDGDAMTMTLLLTLKGKIEQAQVDFENLEISTEDASPKGMSSEILPDNIIVEQVHILSRVREPEEGAAGAIAHDLSFRIDNFATDRNPPDGFSNEVRLLEIDITRTSDEMVGFHNGSLRVDRQRQSDAKDVAIRKARIEWEPVIVDLTGELRAPPKKDFSGNALLAMKGHRDLIRVLTEEGEISPLASVLSGALLGALEMAGTAREDGTIELPLRIDDGDVKFLFLPLTDLDELRRAVGQS